MKMDTRLLVDNLLPAVGVNVGLGLLALRVGGVRGSGFVGGILIGIPIYLFLGWRGFVLLTAMFVAGTALTWMGYARKKALGTAEERRGARGASHALANGGVAVLFSAAAWVWDEPFWSVAFAGTLVTSAMDTAGSEIGPLWGKRTISLRDLRRVPPGTEGAVSVEGTAGGILVALTLALVAWRVGLQPAGAIPPVVLGAWIGNLCEGALGSRHLLPHAWLNATNTLVGGLAAAILARATGAL